MKTFKKALAVVLCVVMTLTAAPLGGLVGLELPNLFDFKAEAAYSGTCGTNLNWSLDTSTGVLKIIGTGAMTDYTYESRAPWYDVCSDIKTVNIADGVTSIGGSAFSNCKSLTDIDLPDSVITIGDSAFFYCENLPCVTIPDSVTNIGENTFWHCTSLTSVTIPDSVTSIGWWAFEYCTSLTSVTIGDSVTSIGGYAFAKCTSLTSITVDANNKNYSSNSDGVLFNKDKTTLVQYPIGNTRISYTIPESVTSIGDYAFYYCKSLTSITITDNVTTIGDWAFYTCSGIKELKMPVSAKIYDGTTFKGCTSIEKVILTKGTGVMQSYTVDTYSSSDNYYGNTPWYISGCKVVIIEDGVRNIGKYAFAGCDSLVNITIPNSIQVIRDYAFAGCDSLSDVYYNSCSKSWAQKEICSNNTDLTNATIHYAYYYIKWINDGVTTEDRIKVGDSIVVPADPEKEGHTFTGWDKEIASTVPDEDLVYTATWKKNSYTVKWNIDGVITEETYEYGDEITVPENPSKDGVFFTGWGAAVPETMPGKNLEFIAQWNKTAFEYEKDEDGNVTIIGAKDASGNIEIPDNINGYRVTAIAEAAFAGSDITSVTIPEGVETIGECAFAYCENLKTVNIPASVSKLGETAFVGSTNIEKSLITDLCVKNEKRY